MDAKSTVDGNDACRLSVVIKVHCIKNKTPLYSRSFSFESYCKL